MRNSICIPTILNAYKIKIIPKKIAIWSFGRWQQITWPLNKPISLLGFYFRCVRRHLNLSPNVFIYNSIKFSDNRWYYFPIIISIMYVFQKFDALPLLSNYMKIQNDTFVSNSIQRPTKGVCKWQFNVSIINSMSSISSFRRSLHP